MPCATAGPSCTLPVAYNGLLPGISATIIRWTVGCMKCVLTTGRGTASTLRGMGKSWCCCCWLLIALRHIVKAYGGLHEVASATGLHEKTLYKSLSASGNPTLKTLLGLAKAINMQVTFTPKTA